MATYNPVNSLSGHHDHLDRLVDDILDDVDECPTVEPDDHEELARNNVTQDVDHGKDGNGSRQICFLNGRSSSSGSSSNGDSRDSGFEGGHGGISTPSLSRRTTTSSDNVSTPSTMSTTSEGLSPLSSDQITSNNSDMELKMCPMTKPIGYGSTSNNRVSIMEGGTDKSFEKLKSELPVTANVEDKSIYNNGTVLRSGEYCFSYRGHPF